MKRKIGGFALVVIMLICSYGTNVFAGQKFINADIKREMQIFEDLGYEIVDFSSERVDSTRSNIQTNCVDVDGTERVAVTEILTTYNVIKDGEPTVIRSLKAAPVRHTFGKKDDLRAWIVWRDNLGPVNKLIYVEARVPTDTGSVKSYDYWKMGWYSSSSRSGSWTGPYMMKYAEDDFPTGLQFCLQVSADGTSLQVNTSITDMD